MLRAGFGPRWGMIRRRREISFLLAVLFVHKISGEFGLPVHKESNESKERPKEGFSLVPLSLCPLFTKSGASSGSPFTKRGPKRDFPSFPSRSALCSQNQGRVGGPVRKESNESKEKP